MTTCVASFVSLLHRSSPLIPIHVFYCLILFWSINHVKCSTSFCLNGYFRVNNLFDPYCSYLFQINNKVNFVGLWIMTLTVESFKRIGASTWKSKVLRKMHRHYISYISLCIRKYLRNDQKRFLCIKMISALFPEMTY